MSRLIKTPKLHLGDTGLACALLGVDGEALCLTGSSWGTFPFALLTPYLNIYIILRGMLTTLANDGINWRGTHYPLAELWKNAPIL